MKIKYNPEIHHRRSIRLRGYDYSQAGAYFVTICRWNRECFFGDFVNGDSLLNEFGRVAETGWLTTGLIRSHIELDDYIVMPNHLHWIVVMNDCRGVLQYAPTQKGLKSPSQTLGAIIRGFKSSVTFNVKDRITSVRKTCFFIDGISYGAQQLIYPADFPKHRYHHSIGGNF